MAGQAAAPPCAAVRGRCPIRRIRPHVHPYRVVFVALVPLPSAFVYSGWALGGAEGASANAASSPLPRGGWEVLHSCTTLRHYGKVYHAFVMVLGVVVVGIFHRASHFSGYEIKSQHLASWVTLLSAHAIL